MRHLNSGRKLNRTSAHRKALFRNLVLSLIQSRADQDHRRQGQGTAAHARTGWSRWASAATSRRVGAPSRFCRSHDAVKKLFDEIAPRFKDRHGRLHPRDQVRRAPRRCRAALDYRIYRRLRGRRAAQEARVRRTPASISTASAAPRRPRAKIRPAEEFTCAAESSAACPVMGSPLFRVRATSDAPSFSRRQSLQVARYKASKIV